MSGGGQYQVRALHRALRIMDSFSVARPELTLPEIATMADLPKSTAFRLLSVLEEHGYVDRVTDSETYRIGIRPFELGSIYLQSTTVEEEARPYLRQLASSCNQTANLGILNRGEVVHVAVVPPERPIHFYASVGDREQAYCAGLGKALISEFDRPALEQLIVEHPLVKHTDNTITDLDTLERELADVRRDGYALDNEERFAGLRCVAAPIRNAKGEIIAAISVSGQALEFVEPALSSYIEEVRNAGNAVSRRLGNAIWKAPEAADGE